MRGVKLRVCHDAESIASICSAQETFLGLKMVPTTAKSDNFSKPYFCGDVISRMNVFCAKQMLAMDSNHNKPLV